jgi:hypothetical protein
MGAGASTQMADGDQVPGTGNPSLAVRSDPLLARALAVWDSAEAETQLEEYDVTFKHAASYSNRTISFQDAAALSRQGYTGMVVGVAQDAADHGVRVGSVMAQVNGQSMAGLPYDEVVAALGSAEWPKVLRLKGPTKAAVGLSDESIGTDFGDVGMDFGLAGEISMVETNDDSPELKQALSIWDATDDPGGGDGAASAMEEYGVSYGEDDWGRLGIVFRDNASRSSAHQAIVVGIEDKAAEKGVRLGSVLLEVCGRSMANLPHRQVIGAVSNAEWPKELRLLGPPAA